MKTLFKTFAGVMVALFLVACSSAPNFKANDPVVVEWYEDSWHLATLVSQCMEGGGADNGIAGWVVDFKDDFYDTEEGSDTLCYPVWSITGDSAPSENDVEVGGTFLAEWFEDSFFSAEVTAITEGKYKVKFLSDGYEQDVTLDQLRALPVTDKPDAGDEDKVEDEADDEGEVIEVEDGTE